MEQLKAYQRHAFDPRIIGPEGRDEGLPALLVIDMQRFFLERRGRAFLPHARAALPCIVAMVEAFRRAALPVVFTRHEDRPDQTSGAMARWWGELMVPGDRSLDIVTELAPRDGEKVVLKHHYSAFRDTGLAGFLREKGVRTVVISGVMTHLCCETSARDAFMENFDVICAVDGTASSCEELHLAALKTLVNGFAMPALASEIAESVAGIGS